jgi:hypothetical protein
MALLWIPRLTNSNWSNSVLFNQQIYVTIYILSCKGDGRVEPVDLETKWTCLVQGGTQMKSK